MENIINGIILVAIPRKQNTYALATSSHGKLTLTVLSAKHVKTLHPGSVVTAVINHSHHLTYQTTALQVISSPLPSSFEDISWIHHTLELFYFFLPDAEPGPEQFRLLQLLLNIHKLKLSEYTKRTMYTLACGIFFLNLGYYPHNNILRALITFKNVIDTSIDFDNPDKVDCSNVHPVDITKDLQIKLDEWLLTCIRAHPQASTFKTPSFVYKPSSL